MNKSQEKKIIKRLKKGDEKAFERIYDLYADKIYRFVFFKINLDETVKEIVQDVFLNFWKVVSDNKTQINNISALLYRMARFRVIDYYRSQGREKEQVSIDDIAITEELIVREEIDKNIDIKYDLEKIKQTLPKLPQVYQDVIVMKFIEEMTNKEIAEVLDKEEGNVRVIIHRALKILRKYLADD